MNIEQCEVMIFRYDGEYGANYSIGLSKKDKEGNYEKGYMPCKFKKGVDIPNKTKIKITNAWLTFNQKDKKTFSYIFISDYELLDETTEEPKQKAVDSVKFDDIEVDDILPF